MSRLPADKIIMQILKTEQKEAVLTNQDQFEILALDDEQIRDARNIARGVYSPLTGFLQREDYLSVLDKMRLSDGSVWPWPVVLDVSKEDKGRLDGQKEILLTNRYGRQMALLREPEIYSYDKAEFAEKVYGTIDKSHPGVADLEFLGEYLLGGEIWLLDDNEDLFKEHALRPEQTRKMFANRGWETVVGFQTRNVPHRGHEFLQKEALKQADGLFIQPVVGRKKTGDFKDEIMVSAYELLLDKYFEKDQAVLGVLPLKMSYAGPREALFHALIRRNFGCTHFIVGRDHAGVGDFYKPFAAQEIFDNFSEEELGIRVLKYPEVIYCETDEKLKFADQCDHDRKVSFSGSFLRDLLKKKNAPPFYLIRPEVYYLLLNNENPLVDAMYQADKQQKGFVLWFTGLSQAGKTTTANEVFKALKRRGYKVERLDGDVVRQSLTADLGFSKKDRDENIKRVGYIAKLFSEKGIIVVASFISPYRKERAGLRQRVKRFVEVYVNAPLKVCEERDTKGLYEKARAGEIKNFTGISDPYETPENPEIELLTDQLTVSEAAKKVISYLAENKYI